MALEELTDYERRRLENIKRNSKMVASLNIHSTLHQLSSSTKRQRVQTKPRQLSSENKAPVTVRRSIRARGMPPDSSTAAGIKHGFLKNLRRIRKSHTSNWQLPRELCPLKMKDVFINGVSDQNFVKTIMGISKKTQFSYRNGSLTGLVEGIGGGSHNLAPESEDSGCSTRAWGSVNPKSIKMEENVRMVVPERVMVLRFLPSPHEKIIMAGDSLGSVGFWNVDVKNEDDDKGGIYLYQPHSGFISGISVQPFSISKIYTSSFDGFIRLMDVEKEEFSPVYSSDYAVLSISQRTNDVGSIYFSEGHGRLKIWDEREGKPSISLILHEDGIKSIDFNANNTNIMATSSTDGTACIWDLRSINAEKPKPLKSVRHEKALYSAYFSPSGSCLLTTGTDNIGLLSGTNYEDVSTICHRNKTSSLFLVCRAIWGWDDSYIFVGNLERGLDVISAAKKSTITTMRIPEISYCFDAHPCKIGMLAGATIDGRVHMWSPC
ncbi:WD repeat-containing protein 76-like [Camellia sinensis]|uniref:WD repeat-containing protein 76-like n=1 Tax=Camellia sinensis TaxID=4442 RepID=UPI0010356661|nr:WD repeat-containing protein 76-like [Camellia sinensis]